jgi:hypothetical protein
MNVSPGAAQISDWIPGVPGSISTEKMGTDCAEAKAGMINIPMISINRSFVFMITTSRRIAFLYVRSGKTARENLTNLFFAISQYERHVNTIKNHARKCKIF